MQLGYLSPEVFSHFLARQPGIASIDLQHYPVSEELNRLGNLLTVAMVCPLDQETIGEIERMTGLRVNPVLCSRSHLWACLESHYGDSSVSDPPLEELSEWFEQEMQPNDPSPVKAFVSFPADDASSPAGFLSWHLACARPS